jgi:dTDP-4-dehydrorhamnose reductase
MRVLVFGPTGQLGTDVVRVFRERGEDVLPVTRELADLTDRATVEALLATGRPDAVVNCAAFHDPAGCEADPELAFAVNAAGVELLARESAKAGAKLMTMSTDYVFDGAKVGGYREEDAPNPLNRYGESKLEGERLALAAHPQTFVVRTQSLFGRTGPRGKGSNFVDLMIRLAKERDELEVDQFRMAPTGTVPLAENMHTLLLTDEFGLYHMSCQGETTWYEFARAILERIGSSTRVVPVANDFYPTTFRRPENTYLINAALQARGLDHMPHWEQALTEYLLAKGVTAAAASRGSA